MNCNHTSVGMIVKKGGKILLIERKIPPFGFAPPAGHLDESESFESAAKRELKEEVGLDAMGLKLIAEGRKENKCSRPQGSWHYWKLYEVSVRGEVDHSRREAKSVGWYSEEEIALMMVRTKEYLEKRISESDWEENPGIEPVWVEWFEEIKLVSSQYKGVEKNNGFC